MNIVHFVLLLLGFSVIMIIAKKNSILMWRQRRWLKEFHQMMDKMYHPPEVAQAAANDPEGWDYAWAVGHIDVRATWNWPKRLVAVHVTAHYTGMEGKIENSLYYCRLNWFGRIVKQHLVAKSEFSNCYYYEMWGHNNDPARHDLYPAMVERGKIGVVLANRRFDQRFFHWTAGGEYQIPQDTLHMLLTTM